MSSTLLAALRREARETLRLATLPGHPPMMPVSDFLRPCESITRRHAYQAEARNSYSRRLAVA